MSRCIEIGKPVPSFEFQATSGVAGSSNNWAGKNIVLYFYPRDNTPGCTQESIDFATLYPQFQQLDITIFGISRDRLITHTNFKKKLNLPFELISDTDETICNLFGVMRDKNMFGKKVKGIERSTFLIDANQKLIKEWRKIKVDDHACDVLQIIQSL